jgi:thioredoxin 1
MPLQVELFVSPYCTRCHAARQQLQAAIADLPPGAVQYQEHDVVQHLERALEVGVKATPSLAVAGHIMLLARWDREVLRTLFDQYLRQEH